MQLVITQAGHVHCVYGEQIDPHVLGRLQLRRASHVEPEDLGQRHADLSAAGGPKLGRFAKRSEALAAEVRRLEQQWRLAAVDVYEA